MKKNLKQMKLYFNQKQAIENKRMLFHKEVEITFQGKVALINESKKETEPNYKIEVSNYHIVSRNGNYKIIYTDEDGKNYEAYFSIRKKIPIFVFFLLFLPIFLFSFHSKNNVTQDIIEKKLPIAVVGQKNQENTKVPTPVFHMHVSKGEMLEEKINLRETVDKESLVGNKIAPGTKGDFIISIDTYNSSEPLKYEIKIYETTKPKNLYFTTEDEREYESLEELAKVELKGEIGKNAKKDFWLNWEWKYDINTEEDEKDIEDAKEIEKYQFEIIAIGKEM